MNIKDNLREYFSLFIAFFKIGSITFGGGLAMLPIMEKELAENRNWTTKEELLDYYAIGQSTPGIIAVNVATFVGYNRKGILGGIVATAGVVVPSIIIISILAECISSLSQIEWMQKALAGINVAVTALLTKTVWQFSRRSIKNFFSFIIFAAAFCAIYFFNVNTVLVIATGGILGILLNFVLCNPNKKKSNTDKEQPK